MSENYLQKPEEFKNSGQKIQYEHNDKRINKARDMFYSAFKQCDCSVVDEQCRLKALELAEAIFKFNPEQFPKIVRMKAKSLKENKEICWMIYNDELCSTAFIRMSQDETKSSEQRDCDRKIMEESLKASTKADIQAETTMFKCSKCKKNKCRYYQMQTRSCDEPMTTFVRCTECGHNWKF
ncbi:TFS2 [Enterospora canceri]|uniref:TFS2 n=1 Tax=Enterospora canceri TaxID=1081671 RepID=A0A1Y1S9K7_9MICR|nr:TFS2 [Enterospora canceri]